MTNSFKLIDLDRGLDLPVGATSLAQVWILLGQVDVDVDLGLDLYLMI